MPCKLDFDNPNRGDIIDAYLDSLSDRYDMEKIKRSQLGYPETGVSYSDHTEVEVEVVFEYRPACEKKMNGGANNG